MEDANHVLTKLDSTTANAYAQHPTTTMVTQINASQNVLLLYNGMVTLVYAHQTQYHSTINVKYAHQTQNQIHSKQHASVTIIGHMTHIIIYVIIHAQQINN